MSEIQEDIIQEDEEEALVENREKLFRIGKILLGASVVIVWGVSAGLGLRDIWTGSGVLDSPWIIFSIVFTFVLIIVVIIPLFKGLRTDIQDYKERQDTKE
jgi:hypothetical protein